MKRTLALVAVVALMLGLLVGVVGADEETPAHGHMLIQGLEIISLEPVVVTYQKCVDLANNQALPLNAQHEHLHTGTAGEALFANAGHLVSPTAPITPIRDCAHLAELFGPPTE